MVNICMKSHEDILSRLQVTGRTRFCDRKTEGRTVRAKTVSPNLERGRLKLTTGTGSSMLLAHLSGMPACELIGWDLS